MDRWISINICAMVTSMIMIVIIIMVMPIVIMPKPRRPRMPPHRVRIPIPRRNINNVGWGINMMNDWPCTHIHIIIVVSMRSCITI